ncbi:hypothetical protein HMI49_30740 [Corallococcus exercitus]|uniref:Uncharacterized protein n=1 Tax=Corallococcus exercitus TaxID=2316736 RepID=A0A7Y4NUG2_9BACT|nr:hypothetical protein [Corallococcus exercitus]NOK37584.1 hypothetical protein [Corallococcus exercitus]
MSRIPKPVSTSFKARPEGARSPATPPTTLPNLSNVANQSKIPKPVNTPANAHYKPRQDGPRPPRDSTQPNRTQSALQSHQGVSTFNSPATSSTQAAGSSNTGVRYPQGPCPPMAPLPAGRRQTALKLDNAACLTHGISPEHVQGALQQGQLHSAYSRLGKEGNYSRDADKNGGGALAVYTRAVGTEQTAWKAQGSGVGSNDSKVQMILSPAVLANPDHGWRAGSTDNMGKVPGSTAAHQAGLPKNDPLGRAPLWSRQTESGRNSAFNDTVSGKAVQANNEQLHWEKVPLQGNLKGMVVTSQSSFDTLMGIPGAQRGGTAGRGTVRFGDQDVPVILTSGQSSLLSTLKSAGIANPSGQVR